MSSPKPVIVRFAVSRLFWVFDKLPVVLRVMDFAYAGKSRARRLL